MSNQLSALRPALRLSEPILAVANVPAALRFYRDVLGFESEWQWDDPPTFGGVRWGRIHVMFCLQPELATKVEGHQHAFFCEHINQLYERHLLKNAPVISPIENKPWGIREYTIRDINGYHLRFGGPLKYEPPATARATLPEFIRIIERLSTVEEFETLAAAVGWDRNAERTSQALSNSLYGVVAIDTRAKGEKQIVGCLRVLGDGAKAFYIHDVMVVPPLQGQRIGSAMMEAAMTWLRHTAPKGSFIGLFTGRPGFYERFGFQSGHGMSLVL